MQRQPLAGEVRIVIEVINAVGVEQASRPSNSATSCAADRRITPSLIAGHLNLAPSSRFQISTKPRSYPWIERVSR